MPEDKESKVSKEYLTLEEIQALYAKIDALDAEPYKSRFSLLLSKVFDKEE